VSNGTPTTSPFTHAPLSHPNPSASARTPDTAQSKPPLYHPYPYQYPPAPAYPGYGLVAPPPVSKGNPLIEQQPAAAVTDVPAPTASGENGTASEDVGEGSDAWEAAQAILKAINFGSFWQAAASKPAAPSFSPLSNSASSADIGATSDGALAVVPVPNTNNRSVNAATSSVHVLSDRDRASLQAQLALLAAQLAEIAEDTLASDLNGAVEGKDMTGEEGDDYIA
jgi:hypothetical protein